MPAARLGRVAAWLGLALAAAFIVLVGGTYPYASSALVRTAVHVVALLVFGGWALAAIRSPGWRPTGPLVAPAIALGLAAAIAGIRSPEPRIALEGAIGVATGMAVLLLLARLARDPWFGVRLVAISIALPALVAVAYLVQVAALWIEWWGLIGGIAPPPLRPDLAGLWLGSPNLVGALCLAGIPVAVVRLRDRRPGPIAGALLVAGVLALLVGGSRGPLVGLLATGVVWVALLASGGRVRVRATSRRALLAAGLVLVVGVVLGPPLFGRVVSLAGAEQRADLWAASATLFSASPLTGVGAGAWPLEKLAANPAGAANLVVPHAHNSLVHVGTELGLLGIAAGAWLLAVVGRGLVDGLRDPRRRPFAAATIAGLAGFGVASLVDHALNVGTVTLPLALLIALADAERDLPTAAGTSGAALPVRAPSAVIRAPGIALLAGVLVAGGLVLGWDRALLTAAAGEAAAARGDHAAARGALDEAIALDGAHPLLGLEAALLVAEDGRTFDAAAARTLEPALAEAATRDGLAMQFVNLAQVRLVAGDGLGAIDAATDALARDPDDEIVALNVGRIAEVAGDLDLALLAYAGAVAIDPELAASTWWSEPARRVDPTAVLERAAGSLRERGDRFSVAALDAWAIGADAGPASQPGLTPAETHYLAAVSVLRTDGPEPALTLAADGLRLDPYDGRLALLASRLAAAIGDDDAARRYARWASILGATPVARAAKAGSAVADPLAGVRLATPLNYPWAIYGLRGLPLMTVPGVVTLDPRALPGPIVSKGPPSG